MSEIPTNTDKNTAPKKKRNGILVIVFLAIAFMLFNRHEPLNTIDCTPEIIAKKPDVVMLGAWWCSYCYKAKKYFQKNDINYCEYDMENTEEGKRLYQQHGGGPVPIILIGKYKLSGFNEEQINEALIRLERSTNNNTDTSNQR